MKGIDAKLLAGCVLAASLALAGLGLGWVPAGESAGDLQNGPLIQQVTANGFSAVWWHPSEEEAELRLRGGGATGTRLPAVRRDDRYEARATGLEAGTTYWYELALTGASGNARRIFTGQASTAKPPGASCAFIVFADSGSGEQAQYDLAKLMERYPADFILHGDTWFTKRGRSMTTTISSSIHTGPSSIPFHCIRSWATTMCAQTTAAPSWRSSAFRPTAPPWWRRSVVTGLTTATPALSESIQRSTACRLPTR